MLHVEKCMQRDLDILLEREEIFWKDKAKTRWIEDGDANTHFFHLSTIIHRRYNAINCVADENNNWLQSRQEIGEAFRFYFVKLFSTSSPVFPMDFAGLINKSITDPMNDALTTIPTQGEIQKAIFSMGRYKSPGPDRMSVIFYKTYWEILKEATINEVQVFFQSGKIRQSSNHTFIALIPKSLTANKVNQYLPIALCNVIFKAITKILASRLRIVLDGIIHPSQAAFISNRSIGDNIIVNHEIKHYLNKKKGKKGFMAIKIDLAKAYDKVEWNVLTNILTCFGFEDKFIRWIQECISTVQFSVLINGAPHGYFHAGRGIQQGDPLSPSLFTMISEVLSRLLARAESDGALSGIKISRHSPKGTHLMYADDLVIYCKANTQEATSAIAYFNQYCEWTGQEINWHKSVVHYSKNVQPQLQRDIGNILSIQECNHTGRYLDHPFCKFSSKGDAFKGVMEKLMNKLAGWKQQALSMAGRLILLKSVAQAVPNYTMQTFMLP